MSTRFIQSASCPASSTRPQDMHLGRGQKLPMTARLNAKQTRLRDRGHRRARDAPSSARGGMFAAFSRLFYFLGLYFYFSSFFAPARFAGGGSKVRVKQASCCCCCRSGGTPPNPLYLHTPTYLTLTALAYPSPFLFFCVLPLLTCPHGWLPVRDRQATNTKIVIGL